MLCKAKVFKTASVIFGLTVWVMVGDVLCFSDDRSVIHSVTRGILTLIASVCGTAMLVTHEKHEKHEKKDNK
jgi:hypothetical protein